MLFNLAWESAILLGEDYGDIGSVLGHRSLNCLLKRALWHVKTQECIELISFRYSGNTISHDIR